LKQTKCWRSNCDNQQQQGSVTNGKHEKEIKVYIKCGDAKMLKGHRATILLGPDPVTIPVEGCSAFKGFDESGGDDSRFEVPNRLIRDGGEKPVFREPSSLLPSRKWLEVGCALRTSSGEELCERNPVFRSRASLSTLLNCPGLCNRWSCSVPYGVLAVEELAAEALSGSVDADPLGTLMSTTCF
jgi:hypothetical protein